MDTARNEGEFPPLSPPHLRKKSKDDEFSILNETDDDLVAEDKQDKKEETLATVTPEKRARDENSKTSEKECSQSRGENDDQTLNTVAAKDTKVNDGTYRFFQHAMEPYEL
jgi:hypothetical protein